ncbi:alpha/beta fold hydrolase [Deinococcus altitudinis]|uniref:alpha/beta fold hydrolase n=1 Tax=Deinococcus altitudinis TaxID=468914 RepID=UPI003891A45E
MSASDFEHPRSPAPAGTPHTSQQKPAARKNAPAKANQTPATSQAPARKVAGPALTPPRPKAEGASPRQLADLLSRLLEGTGKNLIGKGIMRTLEYTPHISTAVQAVGRPVLANSMMGSTRELAKRGPRDSDDLSNYQMPVVGESALVERARSLLALARKGNVLEHTLKVFEAQNDKTIYAVLGERIRDTRLRSKLLAELPLPISQAQLTRDAFLENIAVGMAYSNDSAAQLNDGSRPDQNRGGSPGKLLHAFGYIAEEPLSGTWGLQLRVFRPDPNKAKGQPVIVAFRGTEGVAFNPDTNKEGTTDTLIGDFASHEPGVNQFAANRAWIDAVVKRATARGQKITFVGHSLGGALAQEAAAQYPQVTAGVVTFQSANIPQADVNRVSTYNKAHPEARVLARHYRVEGDTVPTSGTASLPGQITYFDRVSRAAGSQEPMSTAPVAEIVARRQADPALGRMARFGLDKLATSVPFMTPDAAVSGHVVPILSTYLHGLPADQKGGSQTGQPDKQRQALLDDGVQDAAAVGHPVMKGGKPVLDNAGKPRVTPPSQDVGAVVAGTYTTQADPKLPYTQTHLDDPRLKGEAARAHVMPELVSLIGGGAGAQVFEQNIAFNTAMHHLFLLAEHSKTQAEYEVEAKAFLAKEKLEMLPEDLELARQMNLDKSPRVNAQHALQDLAGINANRVTLEAGGAGSLVPGLSIVTAPAAALKAREEFQHFIHEFSDRPTLDAYKDPDGGYEVVFDLVTAAFIKRQVHLVWDLFHGEKKK